MIIKFPEPVGPNLLLDCSFESEGMSSDLFKLIVDANGVELMAAVDKLYNESNSMMDYFIAYYHDRPFVNRIFGDYIVGGGIFIDQNERKYSIEELKMRINNNNLYVAENYVESTPVSGIFRVYGFFDSITQEIDVRDIS